MKMLVDIEKLKERINKPCKCNLKKMCICDDLLERGICVCGIFKSKEEIEDERLAWG
ncbi:hypothetical protein EOM39_01155 [Candidatus Gracilibacteria bacterium]|nr:hypothetical protein [Candidatus Gracilibacteria bacterium]